MVELITVMVVIGILAAIAVPRIGNIDAFSENVYRNEVASALRHAQKSAVSHRRVVCAVIAANTTITLRIASTAGDTNCDAAYASPDGSAYVSRGGGVAVGGAFVGNRLLFLPNGEIHIDAPGLPFATGTISVTGQPDIRIDGSTGYVE